MRFDQSIRKDKAWTVKGAGRRVRPLRMHSRVDELSAAHVTVSGPTAHGTLPLRRTTHNTWTKSRLKSFTRYRRSIFMPYNITL